MHPLIGNNIMQVVMLTKINFMRNLILKICLVNLVLIGVVYLLKLNFFFGIIFLFPAYIANYALFTIWHMKNKQISNSKYYILILLLSIAMLFGHGYLQAVLIDFADWNKTIPFYINLLSSTFAVLMWSLPISYFYYCKGIPKE